MGQQMPQHRFASHGRRDINTNERHQPMTVAPGQPQQQQSAQQVTPTLQRYDQALDVWQAHQDWHAAVGAQNWDPAEKARVMRQFADTPQAKSLDTIEQGFDQRAAAADADYSNLVAQKALAVDESAAVRIRDRHLERVKAAPSAVSAAQQILESCPDQELAVALQEIPSWLQSNGHPTDFVETVLRERCPDIAEKAEVKRKAEAAAIIGHQTALQIRKGVQSGSPARVLMKRDDVRKYDPDA
jgi:hypothetical protein